MRIRDATDSDVPAILAIYNDVVTNTTAIYDERPSTLDERKAWFDARRQKGLPVGVKLGYGGDGLRGVQRGDPTLRYGPIDVEAARELVRNRVAERTETA